MKKYYLNLNPDNYLLSVSKTDTGGPAVDSLDALDLSGCKINAYRWDGERLLLDEERFVRLQAEYVDEPSGESVPGDSPSWDILAAAIREGVDSV